MKASNKYWRERLVERTSPQLVKELDVYESEISLKKQGKIDDKIFAETRLRRGSYGQRYDNGQRYDGRTTRRIEYPSGELTKGPSTLFDAPGMQRIKIPFGGLNADQLDTLAELAEEYSDGIAHVTTRQDIQLHFVHIEDTPTIMRRLAAVGITTREACGNTVRNVTGCHLAGVCQTQVFDVTPHAKACSRFLLGHPDTQNFGRKFKVSFSGCKDQACALARLNDIGCIAAVRDVDGKLKRGFEVYVGGGLGTVPYQAKLFEEFVPEEEILPLAQAIGLVFARLGERKNRNTARLKFLVNKLGMEEFKRLVLEQRANLPHEDAWTSYLKDIDTADEEPLKSPSLVQISGTQPESVKQWYRTNVYEQRQNGYATITITLPLGDITATQLRKVADLARTYVKDTVRTTIEQNIVLRWVSGADVPAVYAELDSVGLAAPGAGTIVDIASCPGTDTCKLGIASSRGLAGELRTRIIARGMELEEAIRGLHIKISGCFNSCGQHHVADLGFYGVSRNKNGYTVPHFQVVLGGQWGENAGAYGLAIGAVPSKRIPETVDRITGRYITERVEGESFQAFIKRIGKAECKKMIDDLTQVPLHDVAPSFYTDWADAREFTTGDLGVGECAGEIVSPFEFQITACEREAFEAQLSLEAGDIDKAAGLAYGAMLNGAAALLRSRMVTAGSPDEIVALFRTHFYDTQLFFDPFTGGKFAHYFFRAHERAGEKRSAESVHRLIEETQLFIEACHSCYGKSLQQMVAV